MKYKIIKTIILYFVTITIGVVKVSAQIVPSPIPIELTIGNNNFGLQTVITRNFHKSKKLSFLSVGVVQSDYLNTNIGEKKYLLNIEIPITQ
jgi:hypothetical protein